MRGCNQGVLFLTVRDKQIPVYKLLVFIAFAFLVTFS